MSAKDHLLIRQLPNTLTVLRLCAVPVFVVLFLQSDGFSLAAGLVFMAAAFTDFFDGFIARRAGVMSQFGKVVDPLADRLLVSSAAIMLSLQDHADRLPSWAFIVVVWRDVLTMIGYFIVKQRLLPDVNRAGKAGTFGMMGGMAWLLVLKDAEWPVWFFWAGVILSVIALVEYIGKYSWVLDKQEAAKRRFQEAKSSGLRRKDSAANNPVDQGESALYSTGQSSEHEGEAADETPTGTGEEGSGSTS